MIILQAAFILTVCFIAAVGIPHSYSRFIYKTDIVKTLVWCMQIQTLLLLSPDSMLQLSEIYVWMVTICEFFVCKILSANVLFPLRPETK